jgi:hypothetical protein
MKKISVWMLALLLVSGVVVMAGCKKAEETDNTATGEPLADATPTPTMETLPEATPVLEATPAMGDNAAAATPSPAAQ